LISQIFLRKREKNYYKKGGKMDFRILGGNTKSNPEAKKDLTKDKKYQIPDSEKITHAHIRAGKLCFGDLLQMSGAKRIRYLAGGNKKIIKIIETQRGKFIELIPADYISFPDWDGTIFTRVVFHTDNSTILFIPIKPSQIPTPITKRIILL
jgi:hypothetical protein